jgi:hypothetical protein
VADRKQPPLSKLKAIKDPERFLWRILPHAARTFSLSIVFLPARMRRALAVAYLYCRMLDTYEDLLPTTDEKQRALQLFIKRFAADNELQSAPAINPSLCNLLPQLIPPCLQMCAKAHIHYWSIVQNLSIACLTDYSMNIGMPFGDSCSAWGRE